jgi:hypothetical protein
MDPELHLAVMATLPHVAVQLSAIGRAVRTEVWDCSPDVPTIQKQDDESESGRGLILVEALSERWGSYLPPTGGKVVWFDLVATTTEIDPVQPAVPPSLPKRIYVPKVAR